MSWYFCEVCGDISPGICENPNCELYEPELLAQIKKKPKTKEVKMGHVKFTNKTGLTLRVMTNALHKEVKSLKDGETLDVPVKFGYEGPTSCPEQSIHFTSNSLLKKEDNKRVKDVVGPDIHRKAIPIVNLGMFRTIDNCSEIPIAVALTDKKIKLFKEQIKQMGEHISLLTDFKNKLETKKEVKNENQKITSKG